MSEPPSSAPVSSRICALRRYQSRFCGHACRRDPWWSVQRKGSRPSIANALGSMDRICMVDSDRWALADCFNRPGRLDDFAEASQLSEQGVHILGEHSSTRKHGVAANFIPCAISPDSQRSPASSRLRYFDKGLHSEVSFYILLHHCIGHWRIPICHWVGLTGPPAQDSLSAPGPRWSPQIRPMAVTSKPANGK
jgi:hypothetical protein